MDRIFLLLLDRSISAGWLILAVMALRPLLKRAPRWIVCLLWAAAAVRLVCPIGVESAFSLIPETRTLPSETAGHILAVPVIQGAVTAAGGGTTPAAGTVPPPPPASAADLLPRLAGTVWAAGAALLLAWALLGYLRLRRQVREAAWVRGQVWACDRIDSPFILGIFRPRVYLPSGLAAESRPYVLAHEFAHLRRKDHWWKLLGYLLASVYWFHPLVWAGYVLFCRDIELACDEAAVRDMDLRSRREYSRALLACSTRGAAMAACPLAFGETGVKTRVRAVLRYRRPAFWMVLLGAAACVIVAVCFLTDPETSDQPSPPPAPEYSYAGTVFTWGDRDYHLEEIQPSVTSIMNVTPAEDKLVVECHVSPIHSYYGIFDTASRSFVQWIAGTHFIWQGGDPTTGVYEYWGQLYRYAGEFIADLDLEEGAYVYDLAFQEDGTAVVATITNNEELRTVTIPLTALEPVRYTYSGAVLTYDGADYDLRDMHPLVGAITACTPAGDKLLLETDINYYGVFDTVSRSFLPGISGDQLIWMGDDLSTAVYTYAGRLFGYGGVLLADLELGDGEEVSSLTLTGDGSAVIVAIRAPDGWERTASVTLISPGPLSTGYTPYAAYNLLIAQAREALTTHQRPEGQETDPFSFLFYMPDSQTYQTMGWLLRDIDGDGTEELIFGENDNSGWNGIVFDIYTLSGDEAVHLVSGWERSRYYLCENGAIAHEGSGGAFESSWEWFSYENGELHLTEALRRITGADNVQRNYYITGVEDLGVFDEGWEEEWTQLTDAQAEAVLAKYVYLEPQFTPFTAA